jgi:hypothetical protein
MNKKLTNSEIKKLKRNDLLIMAEEILKTYKKDELYKFIVSGKINDVTKKTIKIEIIDDTGIKESHSNGGRTRTILYKVNTRFWKLIIHSESYVSQSYVRLYSSSVLDNWSLIKNGNPKKDHEIDISYRTSYISNAFDGIVRHYQEIIKKMS